MRTTLVSTLISMAAACSSPHESEVPLAAGTHHPQGTRLTWSSNPPSSGPHYPVWAPWARVYEQPVPRGNYVHNLEHGGVVLLYRCPAGCPDVVAGLKKVADSLPLDAECESPVSARWLITPDPLLPDDVVVAAASWGFTYTARYLDEASLRGFLVEHYGQASEDTCAEGAIAWQP